MKRPTAASLKRVNAQNLAALGSERLAEILVSVADTKPELKRWLRMELAAEQGADHLCVEIDKRLASLETSRSKVSWRQRPTFVRDLDVLRVLIADRLSGLDSAAALDRMWLFMDLAPRLGPRVHDRDGDLAAVFDRGSHDLGRLIKGASDALAAAGLVEALVGNPVGWAEWLPAVLQLSSPELAQTALRLISARPGAVPGWIKLIRQLADAAGDLEAFRSTFSDEALRNPSIAADLAQRLLRAQRIEEAGRVLEAAKGAFVTGKPAPKARLAEPDFDWETAWIDYLDCSGQAEAAQALRWSSFERTLSMDRAKAFIRRLPDFDDVEAESRAFEFASGHADFGRGLKFLMDWPAVPEAGRMIQARPEEVRVHHVLAELWASKLRVRQPTAAHLLLRKAAAEAFKRREYATCDRLTKEADAIVV